MLTDLTLRDFRCFENGSVTLHPSLTVFVGRNAQGKTSLMEAACVLLRLQSPRTSDRSELIRFGAGSLLVEGVFDDHRLRYTQTAKARRLALDGAVCGRAADYIAASGRVVWMDHRDMNLLRGGGEHRRRFLDAAAVQMYPEYLNALRGYDRALRGRNYILKREAVISWRQADAFARVMEEYGKVLLTRRRELCEQLAPQVRQVHGDLSGGAEQAEIHYLPGFSGESLSELLLSRREEEQRSRQTAAGPHRDDLRLRLNGIDATAFASEGQQRSLALSLKIAQARALETAAGRAPILMMDDIFGDLDAVRRRALIRLLPPGTQKFVTTTSLDWAREEFQGGAVFEVTGGRLLPVEWPS
jgi:DNA replication and repair protein RecF